MKQTTTSRRSFLKRSTGAFAAATAPSLWTGGRIRGEDKNEQLNVAAIGVGGRGSGIGRQASQFGNTIACCDVDSQRAAAFSQKHGDGCSTYSDYRRILERKDIDVVTIGTPDHWHTKISIEAMLAGKDVYCEKPLSLTIHEGQQINQVVRKTGRVFQVGTQQRSDYGHKFLKAVAIARSGRLGSKLKATVSVGKAKKGGPFTAGDVPRHLDWDMWLGQAPWTPYVKERAHYEFRWWFEYSGGQVTDWGVHHTDIAVWALGLEETGPTRIDGRGVFNRKKGCYNVAHSFDCTLDYDGGHQIVLNSDSNDLTIEGEKGRIQVNRSRIAGKPIEDILESKTERDSLENEVHKLYRGMRMGGHMQNFFDCVRDRKLPISDVFTHHRSVSACHLANISMLLGRPLQWDPKKEDFVADSDASNMLKREQRAPYKIVV